MQENTSHYYSFTEDTPRIYVACLSSYNAGRLHGRWIDCDQTAEEIREEIRLMLEESPESWAEEWAIHDYEGFGGLSLHEHEDIGKLAELGELIGEHREVITYVVDHVGGLDQLEEAKRLMEDCYSGEWNSLEDWAEDFLESSGQIDQMPESMRSYFDFKSYARDVELAGDVFTIDIDGNVHVFWNH